jgi:hypothetical protein
MILLDTDHTRLLKYPDSERGRPMIQRLPSDGSIVSSEFRGGNELSRKATHAAPGLFSNWPTTHTEPSRPGRLNERRPP